MLAVSTEWNSAVYSNKAAMLEAISRLGVKRLELGYRLSEEDLFCLDSLIPEKGMQVTSVHNFCPLPCPGPERRFACDYYRLSSLNGEERKRAVHFTKQTIETACRFSARFVVLHAGMVELPQGYGKNLFRYFQQGRVRRQDFFLRRDELRAARQKHKAPFLDAFTRSLEEVLPYARARGIVLGLENRYYPAEIPDIDEACALLSEYGSQGLAYWHDTGHAEVNERLGICPHLEYLQRLGGFLAGIHIHDLTGINDHMAPFSGDCAFERILPFFIGKDIPLVIEAHQQASEPQMQEAVCRLKEMIGSRE